MEKRKRKYIILICIVMCIGIAIFLLMKPKITQNERLAQRVHTAVEEHLFPEKQFTYAEDKWFKTVCYTQYNDMKITYLPENKWEEYARVEVQYDIYDLLITYHKDRFNIYLDSDTFRGRYTLDINYKLYDDSDSFFPLYNENPTDYNRVIEHIPETVIQEYMQKFNEYTTTILEQIETNEAE